MLITCIILTLDEARHLGRCIASLDGVADEVIVVDSGSVDGTREIARGLGARVIKHEFVNHAEQLNWALGEFAPRGRWLMRLDADEYLTPELAAALRGRLEGAPAAVAGYTLNRRRVFMGRWLRHGALYPIRMLRLWRSGRGRCEARWMDEHIVVDGEVGHIPLDFCDHNLQPLGGWTLKHDGYASREAVEILDRDYGFLGRRDAEAGFRRSRATAVKRFVKDRLYSRMPLGLRALAYFLYRYVLRLGFLDGREGAIFHVLQGFWYRFLIDAKVHEVRAHIRATGRAPAVAVHEILGIDVRRDG